MPDQLIQEAARTVVYYCYACKKDVECRLVAWIEGDASLIPPYRVRVDVEARCSICDMPIGYGSEIVNLY